MKLINNVRIVTPKGVLENHKVLIDGSKIASILPENAVVVEALEEVINGYGGYLVPGFIDLHCDYIEHMVAPRPASVMNFELALYEFEKELVMHGITTMYHSLSLTRTNKRKNSLRNPENTRKLLELIDKSHEQLHLIHHRMHLRYEIENIDIYDDVLEFIDRGWVNLLSFMDHTPGQGQYRNLEVYKNAYLLQNGETDEMAEAMLRERMSHEVLGFDKITTVAEKAFEKGITIASHDDDTIEKLDISKQLHVNISEFPITLEVCKEAHDRGMLTALGAPNVLLGGSHSGNLSAIEAIDMGICDILLTDYYPSSFLHTIFKLVNHGHPLHEVVNMVTLNPAKAVKIDHEVGSVEVGKKADLLILQELPNKIPTITHTLVEGVIVNQTHYRV